MSRRKPSSGPPDPSAINPISIKQALAVAEHLSFRAAARALGVRHSAVSRRVRALEEKLGVTLFERHGDIFGHANRISAGETSALRVLRSRDEACQNYPQTWRAPGACDLPMSQL